MATFPTPDIAEQFLPAVTWNGVPQLGCRCGEFGNGFDWHEYEARVRGLNSGCPFSIPEMRAELYMFPLEFA